MKNLLKVLVLFLFCTDFAFAKSYVNDGAFIYDSEKKFIETVKQIPGVTIDHVNDLGYEAYAPEGLFQKLDEINIRYDNLNILNYINSRFNNYPRYTEIQSKLKALHKKYPDITNLFSIGKTVEGRDLWVMKISDNAKEDEVEPEFKYISSMHGNEITGRELMMNLIEDMLKDYGHDDRITALIDNTEIFIMPSMNPDGSEKGIRGNGHYADLNRDFPDFSTSDNENLLEGREPETQAVMKFQSERQFALSANFHGGAECVNYPWDTMPGKHSRHNLVYDLSLKYSKAVPYIYASREFVNGVTNGYDWYEVNGGMQDWSDYWHRDLQVTIELSQSKWPSYSKIPYYYKENKEALINMMEDVHQGAGFFMKHQGQSGQVTVFKNIDGKLSERGTFSFNNSEFYRLLTPGEYEFFISYNEKFILAKNIIVSADAVTEGGNFREINP
jgi:hypothetical protein